MDFVAGQYSLAEHPFMMNRHATGGHQHRVPDIMTGHESSHRASLRPIFGTSGALCARTSRSACLLAQPWISVPPLRDSRHLVLIEPSKCGKWVSSPKHNYIICLYWPSRNFINNPVCACSHHRDRPHHHHQGPELHHRPACRRLLRHPPAGGSPTVPSCEVSSLQGSGFRVEGGSGPAIPHPA